MKKVIRLTESDLVRIVKRVISEKSSESNEAALTFVDKILDKTIGKLLGVNTTPEEEALAEKVLSAVENGDFEIVRIYKSFMIPKGCEIDVYIDGKIYQVIAKKEKINFDGGSNTWTSIQPPDGDRVGIMASGFTNKIISLVNKSGKTPQYR